MNCRINSHVFKDLLLCIKISDLMMMKRILCEFLYSLHARYHYKRRFFSKRFSSSINNLQSAYTIRYIHTAHNSLIRAYASTANAAPCSSHVLITLSLFDWLLLIEYKHKISRKPKM
jgi:hypothetical protein